MGIERNTTFKPNQDSAKTWKGSENLKYHKLMGQEVSDGIRLMSASAIGAA